MAIASWNGGSGQFGLPTNWTPIGTPGTADVALFATGATGAYTVSGGGSVGGIGVDADQVTLTGTVGTVGGPFNPANYGPTAVSIRNGATLSIAPGAALTGTDRAFVGDYVSSLPSAGSLVVSGRVAEASMFVYPSGSVTVSGQAASLDNVAGTSLFGGSLTVVNSGQHSGGVTFTGGTLTLDSSAHFTGSLGGQVGSIHAIAGPGSTQSVLLNTPLNLAFNGPDTLIQADAGTSLTLAGSISQTTTDGQGLLATQGAITLSGTGNSYSSNTVIRGGTLTLASAQAAGTGAVFFGANVNATLIVGPGASANPNGATLVVAAAGSDTVATSNSSVLGFGGSGALTFYNGTAASTVIGGTGSTTLFGGTGGGVYYGGMHGGNTIVAGTQASTVVGGGAGDLLVANGARGDLVVASAGNTTLAAGNSTGNNSFFGGSGANLILAGAGQDTVISGRGNDTVFTGGSSNTHIFAGSGTDLIVEGSGADTVTFGTGRSTVYAGSGSDVFRAINGGAGGTDLIVGFKSGTDRIQLFGYANAPAIASAGGSTTITLADNTQIILSGVAALRAGDVV